MTSSSSCESSAIFQVKKVVLHVVALDLYAAVLAATALAEAAIATMCRPCERS